MVHLGWLQEMSWISIDRNFHVSGYHTLKYQTTVIIICSWVGVSVTIDVYWCVRWQFESIPVDLCSHIGCLSQCGGEFPQSLLQFPQNCLLHICRMNHVTLFSQKSWGLHHYQGGDQYPVARSPYNLSQMPEPLLVCLIWPFPTTSFHLIGRSYDTSGLHLL